MEFTFLTHPEVMGAVIRWDDTAVKTPELVAAALAAGFSEWEIRESPLGTLEADFSASPFPTFRCSAQVLIGINGSTLIEVL